MPKNKHVTKESAKWRYEYRYTHGADTRSVCTVRTVIYPLFLSSVPSVVIRVGIPWKPDTGSWGFEVGARWFDSLTCRGSLPDSNEHREGEQNL